MTFQWKLGTIGLNLRAASLTLLRVINPKNQNKIERIGQKERKLKNDGHRLGRVLDQV